MSLDTDRWRRVRELFDHALGLEGEERARFLADACEGDEELRREVERLLVEDEDPSDYLEPPEHEELEGSLSTSLLHAGKRIGTYELERVIGRGGMATVYLAHRVDEHFEQRVALKLIRRGMDTDDILRRFKNERQVLADLDHPGIARLIDGGATAHGIPYIVMEYVQGEPLDRYCDDRRLTIRERLVIFRAICKAVQHAHGERVVHRDLKPSNILVRADGSPKLLDFGIAKLLDATGSMRTVDITATELRLMTPEYASPEQVRGEKLSAACDVYSLGVILYELLAGHRLYGTVRQRSELERRICVEDPPKPSATSSRPLSGDGARRWPSEGRGTTTRKLQSELAGDLDTIVSMALRKEPGRRYMSAGALADDIGRWLQARPVLARPDTWRYRSAKFVRRNKGLVAAAAAVLVTLFAGLITSLELYFEAESGRASGAEREYVAHIAAAANAVRARDAVDARRRLERTAPEHRGWEWRHFWARTDRSLVTLAVPSRLHRLAWSPDGALLAGADEGEVLLWEAATGAELFRWEDLSERATGLGFEHGARRLWAVVRFVGLRCWDIETGEEVSRRDLPEVDLAAFDPAGGRVAWGTLGGGIGVAELASDREPLRLEGHTKPVWRLAFAPGGDHLVSSAGDLTVRLWDLRTGEGRVVGSGERFLSVAFDPRRGRIAAGDERGTVWIGEVDAGGELRRVIETNDRPVEDLAFDPGGHLLAGALRDRTIAIWDVAAGERRATLLGHAGPPSSVRFDPAGSRLASGAETVKLWDADATDVRSFQVEPGWHLTLAPSGDGRLATTAWELGEATSVGIEVRSLPSGEPAWRKLTELTRIARPGSAPSSHVKWSPGGALIGQTISKDFQLRVWDAVDGSLRASWFIEENRFSSAFAFSPDGARIVTGGSRLRIWDARTGESMKEFPAADGWVHAVAFGPSGERVLAGDAHGVGHLWDVRSARPVASLKGHTGAIAAVAFRRDGHQCATGSHDLTARLWRASDGRLEHVLDGHSDHLVDLAYSPDGTRVATASLDRTVRIWDPEAGREVAILHGHGHPITGLAFDPGGTLLSVDRSGTVLVWDAPLPRDD